MVLPNFDELLKKYAKLLIVKGINVQKGHTIILTISADHTKFARLLTEEAYAHGAAEVIVDYTDEKITRQKLLNADLDRLENVPSYVVERSNYLLSKKLHIMVYI